jgi:hypothetical protein
VWQDVCTARQCSRAQDRSPTNQAFHLQTRRLWEAIHSARQSQGTLSILAGIKTSLTGCSHTRTSSMLQPSSTSQPSSPPSTLVTTYLRPTRSSGNTLRRSTRTPTKASKAAGRIEGYQPCRRPHLPNPHPIPRWHRTLCTEVTQDHTSNTAAIAAAATLPCPPMQALIAPSTTTTSTHLSTTATNHKSQATMTWSSLSARCTKHHSLMCTPRDATIINELMGDFKKLARRRQSDRSPTWIPS